MYVYCIQMYTLQFMYIYIYMCVCVCVYIHTHIYGHFKMADDVKEDIENALNTIASRTERSGNMKKELKLTIYETVSTLSKLYVKLKDINNSKTRAIAELELQVASKEVELTGAGHRTAKEHPSPSVAPLRDQARQSGKLHHLVLSR